MKEELQPVKFVDDTVADAWLNYAKHRFDEVNARIDVLRATARQMIVWIAAAIGLELGYFPKFIDWNVKASLFLIPLCVIVAVPSVVFQIYAIWLFTELGYLYSSILGPAPPSEKLQQSLQTMSDVEAKSKIGQSYSNAYQAYQQEAMKIAAKSKNATLFFVYPVIIFLIVMLVHATVSNLLK